MTTIRSLPVATFSPTDHREPKKAPSETTVTSSKPDLFRKDEFNPGVEASGNRGSVGGRVSVKATGPLEFKASATDLNVGTLKVSVLASSLTNLAPQDTRALKSVRVPEPFSESGATSTFRLVGKGPDQRLEFSIDRANISAWAQAPGVLELTTTSGQMLPLIVSAGEVQADLSQSEIRGETENLAHWEKNLTDLVKDRTAAVAEGTNPGWISRLGEMVDDAQKHVSDARADIARLTVSPELRTEKTRYSSR